MTIDDWIKVAPLISCGAIVISAIVALTVFIYTRRANRRRATLDMVIKTFLDDDGRRRYDQFKELMRRDRDQNDPFKLLSLIKLTKENGDERSVLVSQLNTYELVALGIRRGIFDEAFYKLWFHRQFTKDYESMTPFLSAVQEDGPTIFVEFRYLYQRWMKNRHPAASPWRIQMAWWAWTKNYKKIDAVRKAMDS